MFVFLLFDQITLHTLHNIERTMLPFANCNHKKKMHLSARIIYCVRHAITIYSWIYHNAKCSIFYYTWTTEYNVPNTDKNPYFSFFSALTPKYLILVRMTGLCMICLHVYHHHRWSYHYEQIKKNPISHIIYYYYYYCYIREYLYLLEIWVFIEIQVIWIKYIHQP